MVVENGFAVCFEDRLGGHCERCSSSCRLRSVSILTERCGGFIHICCRSLSLQIYNVLGYRCYLSVQSGGIGGVGGVKWASYYVWHLAIEDLALVRKEALV